MAPNENLVGQLVEGRYDFGPILGAGGMGTVYRARHVALERDVAIKVLRPQLAGQQTWLRRFLHEARALSKIRHVNVVETLDFGTLPDGSAYCVMELLEGQDLSKLVRSLGRVPWPRARSILLQMARGLGAAHARGVIHRDVKPANCFLVDAADGPDLVKLLDFGIAKLVGDDRSELTATNELIGTAEYMAPERAARGVADARADIYSLGVVAYKMLTGAVPFQGETMFATLTQQVHAAPPSMRAREPSISAVVESVVLKALAKDPSARYQSMDELEAALGSIDESGCGEGPAADLPAADPPLGIVATAASDADDDAATEVDTRVSGLTESQAAAGAVRRRSWLPWVAGVAVLIVAGSIATAWHFLRIGSNEVRPPAAVVSAAPAPVEVEVEVEERPATAKVHEAALPEVEEHPIESPPPVEAAAVESEQPSAPRTARRHKPKPAPTTDAAVLAKLRKRARHRCKGTAEGKVLVKFSILSSGRISLPRAGPPHEHSAAGRCLIAVVQGASFPEGRLRAAKLEVQL